MTDLWVRSQITNYDNDLGVAVCVGDFKTAFVIRTGCIVGGAKTITKAQVAAVLKALAQRLEHPEEAQP